MVNSPRNSQELVRPYQDQRDMMAELGESLADLFTLSDLVRPSHTERLFLLGPLYCGLAVTLAACAAVLISDGRSLFVLGDVIAAVALVCGAFAAFLLALGGRHCVTAYMASPLIVQCLFLVAVKSAALFLVGSRSWDQLLAVVIVTTLGSTFAEVVAMAWRIRRVDSEPVVVWQRVGRFVGVGLAVATASSIWRLPW